MSLLNRKDALVMKAKNKLIKQENHRLKQENQALRQANLKLTIENEFVKKLHVLVNQRNKNQKPKK
ncbi:hypothetical protein F5ESL0247_07320 [Lactobacillus sp. ESL0247]|nr:hypothetical protein F5ESL0247_07320 [Lactobacillus sp. ESL0247]